MDIDKNKLVDSGGKPLTQSMFLELGYSDYSYYTLKDNHYEYEGTLYPSLKQLYLEELDPTEYIFANKYLLSWKHWQRLCENKIIRRHIDDWRLELELKIRFMGIKATIDAAKTGNYQAAKWLAERGWGEKRQAGRPSKAEVEREKNMQLALENEYGADIIRLRN